MNGNMLGDDLYKGKGYGGGASYDGEVQEGYPGCVMFEIWLQLEIKSWIAMMGLVRQRCSDIQYRLLFFKHQIQLANTIYCQVKST